MYMWTWKSTHFVSSTIGMARRRVKKNCTQTLDQDKKLSTFKVNDVTIPIFDWILANFVHNGYTIFDTFFIAHNLSNVLHKMDIYQVMYFKRSMRKQTTQLSILNQIVNENCVKIMFEIWNDCIISKINFSKSVCDKFPQSLLDNCDFNVSQKTHAT